MIGEHDTERLKELVNLGIEKDHQAYEKIMQSYQKVNFLIDSEKRSHL